MPAQSSNGAHDCGEGFDIESLRLNGRCRRKAAVADRDRERRKWGDSCRSRTEPTASIKRSQRAKRGRCGHPSWSPRPRSSPGSAPAGREARWASRSRARDGRGRSRHAVRACGLLGRGRFREPSRNRLPPSSCPVPGASDCRKFVNFEIGEMSNDIGASSRHPCASEAACERILQAHWHSDAPENWPKPPPPISLD